MQSNTRCALRAILKSSAAVMGALLIAPVHADPLGGRVATGSASISNAANTTTVTQTSEGVVIDWSSFNVGKGQTTTFAQPNAQAIAVNRIGGNSASQIFGTVDANGRLVLINGNGILFGKGSQVDVGSLVATSSSGSNSDLLAGKFSNVGSASSSIVNDGKIVTSQGGLVSLVAPNVTNNGTVDAKLGTVSLGGATKFTVDFAGNGLVAFATTSTATGQVTNTGRLQGANVTLTARSAEGLAAGVVNVGGVVEARAANSNGGTIILDSGSLGSIDVTGTLDASGKSGGTILVGGDIHGGAVPSDDFSGTPIEDAATATVAKGALIQANGSNGAGGNIVVWSNGQTTFNGEIRAKGGVGSKGGFAEVSSHDVLAFTGTANLLALNGKTGTLLLDPENVTIEAGTTTGGSFSGGAPNTFVPTEGDSVLSTIDLENALSTSNVEVTTGTTGSQAGNITVSSAFGWTSGNTLTLDAAGAIAIDAPITVGGDGKVVLTTGAGTTGGYSFGLGPFGFGGDISFTGGASSGAALAINGASYKLLYSMSAVQAINASNAALKGRYALAESLDASSVSDWVPLGTSASGSALNSGKGFSGIFEGLGNGISGLSVDEPSISNVGLFGYSSGTIRDVDVSGGTFTGTNSVGALVGLDAGQVEDAYADSTVTGDDYVGGLVGYNLDSRSANQTISDSYAAGTVTGTLDVGGLVGANVATSGGSAFVSDSYATGTVDDTSSSANNSGGLVGLTAQSGTGKSIVEYSFATGSVQGGTDVGGLVGSNAGAIKDSYSMGVIKDAKANVGGLVGQNSGTIAQSYSISAVMNGSPFGGLVGYDSAPSGSITSSYWDTQTSGISSASQGAGNIANDPGITGLTTAQLQASRPTGFISSLWGVGKDLFPYLRWQFPSGKPQSVSGDICCYLNPGQYVTVQVNVTNATALSAASGYAAASGDGNYFYVLLAPGTISPGGSGVLAYLPGVNGGVSFADDAKTSVTGLEIGFAAFTESSAAANYSTIASDLVAAIGTNTALQSQIAGLAFSTIDDSATTFTIDAPIDTGKKPLTIDADDLSIDAGITASAVTLDTKGSISEAAAGFVDANSLTGESKGGAALAGENNIPQLSAFTNSGGGGFSLTDDETLTLVDDDGPDVINAGSGNLTLSVVGTGHTLSLFESDLITPDTATLKSAGSITQENDAGIIQAATLNGSAASGATLDGNNLVATLGTFSTGTGGLELIDATSLTVSKAINTGTAALTISSAGYESSIASTDLTVESELTGGTVTLDAGDNLTEAGSGVVHATTLVANSRTNVDLGGANVFANLSGSATNGSTGSFSAVDDSSMNATNVVSGDTITLTTIGTGHNIAVGGLQTLTPYTGVITLDSAGTISQVGSEAAIYTNTLNGSSVGGTTLNASDNQTGLGNFTNSGAGSISVAGVGDISGKISTGAGAITISGGNLDIASGGQLDTTGTITLTASGNIEEQDLGTSSIDAGTLIASASGEISIFGSGNAIANLGNLSAGQHIVVEDNRSVSITGAISSGYNVVSIETLSGGITVGNSITADGAQYGSVQFLSAGPISESGAGLIAATSLQGSSAGSTTLNGANQIGEILEFTTSSGNFALTNAGSLTVAIGLSAGSGNLTLTTTGAGHNLTIDADIAGNIVDLTSGANIADSGGVIDAASLTGSSTGNAQLTGANAITNLSAFTTGGGDFSLTNNAPLTVVGVVNSGAGTLSLTTTGSGNGLTIKGTLATTGTMDLSSGANIVESTSGGTVDANELNVTAQTGIELESTSNDITTVGTDTTVSGPNDIVQH